LLVIAACQPQQAQVLPTLMSQGETATANTEAIAVSTNQPPTLPPTWTPSPAPTLTETAVPTPTTEAKTSGTGHIFYVFNGDSVVRLSADGASEDLILVGSTPADLTLSPDGTLLAYTAQGSGSAREVFVSNLDGTYTQRVSCLGFARVVDPTWSPDGKMLIFAASQLSDGPIGIYIANFAGSGDCPAGNNQRQLTQLEQNSASDFTWNGDSSLVFFSSNAIYGINSATGEMFPPLTQPTGYGPDSSPAHSPRTPQLMYLKTERDENTGAKSGTIFQVNSAQIGTPQFKEIRGAPLKAQGLRWSNDGRYLAVIGERDVWIQDQQVNTSLQVVTETNFYPQPVFSPDAALLAYVDGGSSAITVPQVFIIGRDGQNLTQITFHQEGTISDLNWSAD
jgi:Tol biopolymer transport system component